MFNNRGQIGETLSWIVATIIIIFLLVVSTAIVGLENKERKIENNGNYDLLATKSLISYLKTNDGILNYNQCKEKDYGELEDNLANKLTEIYSSSFLSSSLRISKLDISWIPSYAENTEGFLFYQPNFIVLDTNKKIVFAIFNTKILGKK